MAIYFDIEILIYNIIETIQAEVKDLSNINKMLR